MQKFAPKDPTEAAPPIGTCPTDEELAAYIDGMLDEAESQRILKHLTSCHQCFSIYAGTLRFQLDSESESADNVVPFPPKTRKPVSWWWSVAALLAVGVGIGIGGYSYLLAPPPAMTTAELTSPIRGKVDTEKEFWLGETMRSGGESEEERLSHEASFRVGVQLINLELSLAANEKRAAQDAVARILRELSTQTFVQKLPEQYKAITLAMEDGKAPRDLLLEVARLAEFSREILEPASDLSYVDLGQWVEAGRLSAIAQEPSFFQQAENRRFLLRTIRRQRVVQEPSFLFLSRKVWKERFGVDDTTLDPAALQSLKDVSDVLDQDTLSSADYARLRQSFDRILEIYYPS